MRPVILRELLFRGLLMLVCFSRLIRASLRNRPPTTVSGSFKGFSDPLDCYPYDELLERLTPASSKLHLFVFIQWKLPDLEPGPQLPVHHENELALGHDTFPCQPTRSTNTLLHCCFEQCTPPIPPFHSDRTLRRRCGYMFSVLVSILWPLGCTRLL